MRILVFLLLIPSFAFAQEFPLKYIEGLPDKQTKDVPVSHAYVLEQHSSMCVACAVTRAGERMLEYDGNTDARYVVAWTHYAGRNVVTEYKDNEVGIYGSDAALAISQIGFLRWDVLAPFEQRQLDAKPLEEFDWGGEDQWRFVFAKYKDKTDKYPVVCPTNVNEIALCLRKGLPVLFLSSARWKSINMRDVDGKGGDRIEFGTTQYNTKDAHVVCLRDYYTLPVVKDGKEYPVEYCNLINSHGEPPLPLKLIWLDWIQLDNKFSCFVILPKTYTPDKN